jgi:hypothetical protein
LKTPSTFFYAPAKYYAAVVLVYKMNATAPFFKGALFHQEKKIKI